MVVGRIELTECIREVLLRFDAFAQNIVLLLFCQLSVRCGELEKRRSKKHEVQPDSCTGRHCHRNADGRRSEGRLIAAFKRSKALRRERRIVCRKAFEEGLADFTLELRWCYC